MLSDHDRRIGERRFQDILARRGINDAYELLWKDAPMNHFTVVTVIHRETRASACYYAEYHEENPRHWLRRFANALDAGTFGASSSENETGAERRYAAH
jgi:hypothetical protein